MFIADPKWFFLSDSGWLIPPDANTYGISGLIGCLLGYDLKESLLYIAGPIMGGGNGAGAVPMSEIYAKASGESTDVIYSKIYPALTLGNWFAVFGAILLKNLGSRFHRLTGNGALMEGYTAEESKKNYDYTLKLGDLGIGMFITVAFFVFGQLVGAYVPAIHAYAFTIIAVALVKIIGIMPDKMEYCAVQWYQFMRSNFTVIIMAGVGIGMFNISTLFEVLSPRYLVMCLIVVMSATLGAGLFGMLVKFFFVESGITAGLCMCNAGGNGDVYVLTASDRMELMPFAQISSRIGGALILIIQSVLVGLLL